jgi:hypothetical protein
MLNASAIMRPPERLVAIKQRADRLNISITRLCRLASAQVASVNRWLAGGRDLQFRNFSNACDRLEAVLDRLETEIFFALAPRFLEPGQIEALKLKHAVADPEPAGAPAALPREEAAL